jgi:hypothetical protein
LILLSQFGAGLLEGLSRSRLLTLLTIPPYAVFSAIFSVAWVRFLLFGTGPAGWKNFKFGQLEFDFVAYSYGIGLACLVPAGLIAVLSMTAYDTGALHIFLIAAAVALAIGGLYAVLRLAFVPTAIAVNRYKSLQSSWSETEHCVVRLMAILCLTVLPISAINTLMPASLTPLLKESRWLFAGAVIISQTLLTAFNAAIGTAALAFAYRFRAKVMAAAARAKTAA